MSLTAGATLQNQKYVIQKILHQSDFGVTYQARHAYLNQEVVLQTLNLALRQRGDFQQIRQQFLNKVRSIAQNIQSVRVLDCFEEGEMPFVVFELSPGQSPPQLLDWFPLMPHTVNPLASIDKATPAKNSVPMPSQALLSRGEIASATAETVPPAPGLAIPSGLKEPTLPFRVNTSVKTAVVSPAMQWTPSKPRSKGWMPIALVSLSMLGGLLGAGFGLSLRLAATSEKSSTAELTPKLPASLFSREQPFPAEADWPISETPQFFITDPTPIEEPIYRTHSETEDFASPNLPIWPDAPLSSPALPTEPSTIQTAPPSLEQPVVSPPPVATDLPNQLPAAPSLPAPPAAAPSIPAEPALPAELPAIPEPVVPELPAPEAPPTLPTGNSGGSAIN